MDIEWLLSGFLSKVFRRGRDNCNFFVHTNLSLKMFFWNIINFRMSFRPWAKYFGLLSKIYRKCFFWKKIMFSFAVIERNVLAFCRKVFGEVVKTACLVSIWTLGQLLFSGKKLLFLINFGHWAIFSDLILKFFWRSSENCILRVHRIILMENLCHWKNFNF